MFGTGLLVFLGCMGVVKGLGQAGDHTGVVLSFALAVFTSIQVGLAPTYLLYMLSETRLTICLIYLTDLLS
jgi:hypothetical protein